MGLDLNIRKYKKDWVKNKNLDSLIPNMNYDTFNDIFYPDKYPEYNTIFHWRHTDKFKNFMLKSKYSHKDSNEDGVIVSIITDELRNFMLEHLRYSLVEEELNSNEIDFSETMINTLKEINLNEEYIYVLDISW